MKIFFSNTERTYDREEQYYSEEFYDFIDTLNASSCFNICISTVNNSAHCEIKSIHKNQYVYLDKKHCLMWGNNPSLNNINGYASLDANKITFYKLSRKSIIIFSGTTTITLSTADF